jgi:5-methylthioribose kinase
LGRVVTPETSRDRFANPAMRELNHQHMFRLPLADPNGLDLDRITDGLGRASERLKNDRVYALRVHELGEAYLCDGGSLVHGDYFPGSWVKGAERVCIIDPEFGFLGAREFDYGVMLGHLALASADITAAGQVVDASGREGLDEGSVLGFAGVEIMRRLIGVAQLPLAADLDAKARLLEVSRSMVIEPERGLKCW